MEPARILLTGGHGFVGAHLRAAMAREFPLAQLNAPDAHAMDVADAAAVERVVAETSPDVCIHLAAISAIGAARADPVRAWAVNALGALNLGRALLRLHPDCLMLYASSAEIYGRTFRPSRAPLTEEALLQPMNVYAASKAAADLGLGALAQEGLRVVRLRLFNHTGPGQSEQFVVPAFARQVARIKAGLQEPKLQHGALDPFRDFLDVRDVCDAYVACIRHADALPTGAILNVASGVPKRIGDILHDLLQLGGVAAAPETGQSLLRPSDIPYAAGDATRLRAFTGWSPRLPWTQTLSDVLADWVLRTASPHGSA